MATRLERVNEYGKPKVDRQVKKRKHNTWEFAQGGKVATRLERVNEYGKPKVDRQVKKRKHNTWESAQGSGFS